MRAALAGMVAVTFLLASCALPALEAPRASRTTAKVSKQQATDARRDADAPDEEDDEATAPAVVATATPSPTPAPTATPKPPMTVFSGLVRVDANYVISAGSGNVISAGSGNVISAGSGNVIAAGAGNVISAGSGNVISAGSGNVISAGSGNYRLLDTASVPVGTMLPVSGMVVVPISLTTGKALGEPVRTDETGAYQLEVPKTVTDQVLIFAAFPVESESDPKLHDSNLRYGLIASADKPALETIDEDTALVTKYALTIFTGRLYELFSQQPGDIDVYLDSQFEGGGLSDLDDLGDNPLLSRTAIKGALKSLYQAAATAGIPGRPAADRKRITQQIVDTLLAKVQLSTLTINPAHYDLSGYVGYPDWWDVWDATRADIDTSTPALTVMRDLFGFVREKVATRMSAPGFQPPAFIATANGLRTDQTPEEAYPAKLTYSIDRPSDYGDFIMREYLATNTTAAALPDLYEVLGAVDAKIYTDARGKRFLTEGLLRAIQVSMLVQLQMQVFLNAEANAAVLKAINEAAQ